MPSIIKITSFPVYSTVPGSMVILNVGPDTVPVPTNSPSMNASITVRPSGADKTEPNIRLPVKKAGGADSGTGVGVGSGKLVKFKLKLIRYEI